jgi:hypothetical protein
VKLPISLILSIVAVTFVFIATAQAHHGPPSNEVLYFADDMIEIEGEVTDVLWRNPHARAKVRILDNAGEETIWELELGPAPRALESRGILPAIFLGQVRAAGYISRRNPRSLGVLHLLLPDGQELAQGNRELRWSGVPLTETSTIDPGKVAMAEREAEGLFRVWGRRSGLGTLLREMVGAQPLTDQGSRLAQMYDPIVDNLELYCQQGMPDTMFDPVPLEIIERGGDIVIHVQQAGVERIVHMDAAEGREEPQLSPLGYSEGRWEGDELVVTTTHVAWPHYSVIGTPQSTQVSYSERFSLLSDGGLLNYSITITDPVVFNEPFTIHVMRDWAPGIKLDPFNCVTEW